MPVEGAKLRHGVDATVRKVVRRGAPDSEAVALKLWHETDEAVLRRVQEEARLLQEMSSITGELPCPRLVDVIGQPLATGVVMEWCPADLERWWRDRLTEPDAFGRLCSVLAEVSHRVDEAHQASLKQHRRVVPHADLKPANVLLSADGRWLISDFGAPLLRSPEDAALGVTRVVTGTENFLAPELILHARQPFPAAIDTWALASMFMALLRLRRMVLDGGPVPRDGANGARVRSHRVTQVIDVYAKDPGRFSGRDIEPGAFPDPLRLPEDDRVLVRECVRGVFGIESRAAEDEVAEQVLDLLDRALSIDPSHRFTSARDLAAAFEALARHWVELAGALSSVGAVAAVAPSPLPASATPSASTARIAVAAVRSAAEFADLQRRVLALEGALAEVRVASRRPAWWSPALFVIVVAQGAALLLLAVIVLLLVVR